MFRIKTICQLIHCFSGIPQLGNKRQSIAGTTAKKIEAKIKQKWWKGHTINKEVCVGNIRKI